MPEQDGQVAQLSIAGSRSSAWDPAFPSALLLPAVQRSILKISEGFEGDLLGLCSFRIRWYPWERPCAPLHVLELGGRLWNAALGLGCDGKAGNSLWNISVSVLCHLCCPSSRRCGRRDFPAVFPAGFPHPSLLGDGLELLGFVAGETQGRVTHSGRRWGLEDRDSGVEVTLGPCVAREGKSYGTAKGRGAEDDGK